MTDSIIAVKLKLPSELIKHLRQHNYDQAIEMIRRIKDRVEDYTKHPKYKNPPPPPDPPLVPPLVRGDKRDEGESLNYNTGDMVSGLADKMNENKFEPGWVLEARIDYKKLQAQLVADISYKVKQRVYSNMVKIKKKLSEGGYKL